MRDFLIMAVLFFTSLFSLSVAWAFLGGVGLQETGGILGFAGFLMLILGLIMSYNWLGEKPDYSRTSYVQKTYGWGPIIYPRPNPGPKPSDRTEQATRSAKIILDLIGLSVIVAGVLLMITSYAWETILATIAP